MKYLIILISMFFSINSLTAQCNCEKVKRDDGTNVTTCEIVQVSSDNSSQIALSVSSNGTNNFLGLTIRFKGSSKNVTKKITILLEDNNMLTLKLVKSQLSFYGNSHVTNAIFNITEANSILLKKSNIKTISYRLENNILYAYKINMNADIVKRSLKCL